MVIYAYSVPAILAFILKIGILFFSLRAERHNFQTRLFLAALLGSMVINIAEIAGFQKLLEPERAFTLHYGAHILTLAILAHLAVSVSFDRFPERLFSATGVLIYGYGFMLEGLLVFTSTLVAGFEPIGDYTYTRIPGPLFWVYELFMLICLAAITVLPVWGLRNDRNIAARNRCKLWIALSMPLTLLILTILVLLHLGFRWFNATVTTPLLVALFLAAVGYAVHHHRLIDLNFYFPWTHLKKLKTGLYTRLVAFGRTIPRFRTVEQLLDRLATILRCPVALIGPHTIFHSTVTDSLLTRFPLHTLHSINRMVVADEIRENSPGLYALMTQHQVAAIVPFFPNSSVARHWLLLGDLFSHSIYMPKDFRQIELLFEKIDGLLLDRLLQPDDRGPSFRRRPIGSIGDIVAPSGSKLRFIEAEKPYTAKSNVLRLTKSLPESVAEFESKLIRRALTSCNGNQAQAARLLGIRPNTLHYKIERYSLSST